MILNLLTKNNHINILNEVSSQIVSADSNLLIKITDTVEIIQLTTITKYKEYVMDKLQIKGNWNIIKGKLKKQYADLTDDDLTYDEGREDELLGRLQKRTGESREEIIERINEYSEKRINVEK